MNTRTTTFQDIAIAGVAFGLWLFTVGVGMWEVYVLRQLYFLLYVRLVDETYFDYESADFFGYCLLPILSFGFIAFMIATAEYHRSNLGRAGSWRLFAITIAFQIAVLLAYETLK